MQLKAPKNLLPKLSMHRILLTMDKKEPGYNYNVTKLRLAFSQIKAASKFHKDCVKTLFRHFVKSLNRSLNKGPKLLYCYCGPLNKFASVSFVIMIQASVYLWKNS